MDLEKEMRMETFYSYRVAVTGVKRQPAALMGAQSTTLQTDAAI